mmetsp:Transcript_44205/g.103669  ORF Transcript_44205/g.103669 Transcript_44205/m.103669 type:complete len:340 (-) Transcript_44205:301-1320(-)|eukprot:CAMPEP_0179890926 /NCGR_PEP_ID=MMETSP0982-20121206/33397_1 /TAXON_ID=483367 /ORGANISM="non described non described, Strain CCMP 2436" /LENGTH=339 /DNA_ID=CAMNT_0021787251 /DNA_START=133 /DNA_END=1152 /DNA_ORIENTATION=+
MKLNYFLTRQSLTALLLPLIRCTAARQIREPLADHVCRSLPAGHEHHVVAQPAQEHALGAVEDGCLLHRLHIDHRVLLRADDEYGRAGAHPRGGLRAAAIGQLFAEVAHVKAARAVRREAGHVAPHRLVGQGACEEESARVGQVARGALECEPACDAQCIPRAAAEEAPDHASVAGGGDRAQQHGGCDGCVPSLEHLLHIRAAERMAYEYHGFAHLCAQEGAHVLHMLVDADRARWRLRRGSGAAEAQRKRVASPRSKVRQPMLGEAPRAVERAMHEDERRARRRRRACDRVLHAEARQVGDARGDLNARRPCARADDEQRSEQGQGSRLSLRSAAGGP